jgi:hypothetical protein
LEERCGRHIDGSDVKTFEKTFRSLNFERLEIESGHARVLGLLERIVLQVGFGVSLAIGEGFRAIGFSLGNHLVNVIGVEGKRVKSIV